eukprot:2631510-Rhodomonas_salina.2
MGFRERPSSNLNPQASASHGSSELGHGSGSGPELGGRKGAGFNTVSALFASSKTPSPVPLANRIMMRCLGLAGGAWFSVSCHRRGHMANSTVVSPLQSCVTVICSEASIPPAPAPAPAPPAPPPAPSPHASEPNPEVDDRCWCVGRCRSCCARQ